MHWDSIDFADVDFQTKYKIRVATCQGNVREKQKFLQVRELSGNFEKMSGNFDHLANVRELSGNFAMTIKFFLTALPSFAGILFSSTKIFCSPLLTQHTFPSYLVKILHYFCDYNLLH